MATRRGNHQGSITYDAKNDRYRGGVTMTDGSRRWVSGQTEADVAQKMRALQGAAASGAVSPKGDMTLRVVMAHWRDYAWPSRQLRPSTVSQYGWALDWLDEGLGSVRLVALTPERVERFYAQLAAEGYAPNSIRLVRTTLSQVLAEAERRGQVARNVAALTHLPADAEPPVERRGSTRPEIARLLDAAKGDRLEALWILAIATGARRGELLGLAWREVDISAGTVSIRQALSRKDGGGYELGAPKTKASIRTVHIGPRAELSVPNAHAKRQKAEHLAAKRWIDSGLVFTSPIGTFLDPSHVRKRWDASCKRAKVDAVFHELRHTVGSYAVEDDVPLARVADQLGHANVTTLARTYRHRVSDAVDVSATTEELLAPPQRPRRKRSRTTP